MEPSAERLSERLETIEKEHRALKQKIWLVAAAWAILSVFGLDLYLREIPNQFNEAVQQAKKNIPKQVKNEVTDQVAATRSEIEEKLQADLDRLVYASIDFQRALKEFEEGNVTLPELAEIVEKRLGNEVVTRMYIDILLRDHLSKSAFDLLKKLKNAKLVPDEYKRPLFYVNAGYTLWINAFEERPPIPRSELIAEARDYLQRAVKEAEINCDAVLANELLVFVHLFQNEKRFALDRARAYKQKGGKASGLLSHKTSDWFKHLVGINPSAEKDLESIVREVFPEKSRKTAFQ